MAAPTIPGTALEIRLILKPNTKRNEEAEPPLHITMCGQVQIAQKVQGDEPTQKQDREKEKQHRHTHRTQHQHKRGDIRTTEAQDQQEAQRLMKNEK
jgi:hypothetical protein